MFLLFERHDDFQASAKQLQILKANAVLFQTSTVSVKDVRLSLVPYLSRKIWPG